MGFHLVERAWHGGWAPSIPEELLFIGGLVLGVSLLVTGIYGLRLIRRVNQVSSRALEILHADSWTARLEEGSAGAIWPSSAAPSTVCSRQPTSSKNCARARGVWRRKARR